MSNFLTVKKVAELLGVRQHAILALIQSDQLRAVDVSLHQGSRPRWRIMADDLDGFILRRTKQPAPPRRRRHAQAPVKHYFP